MRGKLMEIDLGEEARSRNVAMTERARRRLEGDDELVDADERVAEEFRREFLDAMVQRRQRRKAPAPAAGAAAGRKDNPDVLKGPKLGGSRNQRAAVRDLLLQQEKERSKLGKR